MAAHPSSASEWTSAVETAVQAELLRRSRRLKWAVVLSLLVGATAVAVALALRGVTWADLDTALQQRLAPLVKTQISQGEAQIAMNAELARLEAELRRIEAELRASKAAAPVQAARYADGEMLALQQRVRRLELAYNDAAASRARQALAIQALREQAASAAGR
jgi:glucose/arabinose dehydrogenase